jgi:hypothetical protein
VERDELEEIGAMQNVPAGFRSILTDWGVRADGEPGYLRPGWRKPLMKYRFANPVSLCVLQRLVQWEQLVKRKK